MLFRSNQTLKTLDYTTGEEVALESALVDHYLYLSLTIPALEPIIIKKPNI